MAIPWNLISTLRFWSISQMSLWNGSLWMRSSVIHWYWQISWIAIVPSQKWHGFLALLELGLCLPLCEGGVCPWETLPGLDNPLLCFLCLGHWSQSCLAFSFWLFGLLCFGQESALGVLLMEYLLGLHHSFLQLKLLQVPLLHTGNISFSFAGWILHVPQSPWYPSR